MTSLPGVTLYSPNSPYWTIVDMRRNPDIKKITDWYQNYAIDLLGKIPDQLMDPEIED